MITRQDADNAAELVIMTYCQACQCETPEDIRNAGELLISKMARGIEKYAGTPTALAVLNRTVMNIIPAGGQG